MAVSDDYSVPAEDRHLVGGFRDISSESLAAALDALHPSSSSGTSEEEEEELIDVVDGATEMMALFQETVEEIIAPRKKEIEKAVAAGYRTFPANVTDAESVARIKPFRTPVTDIVSRIARDAWKQNVRAAIVGNGEQANGSLLWLANNQQSNGEWALAKAWCEIKVIARRKVLLGRAVFVDLRNQKDIRYENGEPTKSVRMEGDNNGAIAAQMAAILERLTDRRTSDPAQPLTVDAAEEDARLDFAAQVGTLVEECPNVKTIAVATEDGSVKLPIGSLLTDAAWRRYGDILPGAVSKRLADERLKASDAATQTTAIDAAAQNAKVRK